MKKPFQPLEWADRMATGISAIDKQHHFLVDTLQEANEKLLRDENGVLLHQIARDLLGYALTHFETEETLMKRYDYATAFPEDARTHIAQHREFSRQIVAICEQLREGREVSSLEVLTFLNQWLNEHLLGIDQLLGKFLRETAGAAVDGSGQ